MTDGITIEFTHANGNRRRYRFEERMGSGDWWRYEDEYDCGRWRPVGREPVSGVVIERNDTAIVG